jgi:flagellar motility protein MotE (MotC chaperone)
MAIGNIVDKLAGSSFMTKIGPVIDSVEDYMEIFTDMLENIADAILAIVDSPVGNYVIKQTSVVVNFLFDRFLSMLEMFKGVIKIVSGIAKFITGDFSGGLKLMQDGLSGIWKGIVDFFKSVKTLIHDLFANAWDAMKDVLKGLLGSIIDGIKSLGKGIMNFFTGGGDKDKPEEKTADKAAIAAQKKKQAEAEVAHNKQDLAEVNEALKNNKISSEQRKQLEAKKKGLVARIAEVDAAYGLPPVTAASAPAVTPVATVPATGQTPKTTPVPKSPTPAPKEEKKVEQKPIEVPKITDSKDPIEILRSEMEVLNKQTTEMLKYLRDTADNMRANVAATKALNKNLYPT